MLTSGGLATSYLASAYCAGSLVEYGSGVIEGNPGSLSVGFAKATMKAAFTDGIIPSVTTKYVEGDAVILQTTEPFMSSGVLGSSVPVNPDEVIFQVQVEVDGEITYSDSWTWVNPTGDDTDTIQQGVATGLFWASIDSTGHPGTWTGQIFGKPTGADIDITRTQVLKEAFAIVVAPSIPLPS